jgi:hypothetical protein
MKIGMGEYQILRIHSGGVLNPSTVVMIYDGLFGALSFRPPRLLIWLVKELHILYHR